MKRSELLTFLMVVFGLCTEMSNSARILGLFPTAAKSHFIMYSSIMKELADRGHNVTMASPFSMSISKKSYTQVLLKSIEEEDVSIDVLNQMTLTGNLLDMTGFNLKTCKGLLNDPAVMSLIKPGDYDLFVNEIFGSECFLSIGYKLGVPTIGLVSSVTYPWVNDMAGNPENPAYIPNYFSWSDNRMSFMRRVQNTLTLYWSKLVYVYYSKRPSQYISEAVFGPLPSLSSLSNNYSIILINSHFSMNHVRPWVQRMVEIGGVHIPKNIDPLPKDLEKFISEAEHGVIFFSFGTIVPADTIPEVKMKQIISVLGSLKEHVLWKVNGSALPYLPSNIKTANWMPQLSILCHPNTKMFIGHGGLLGLQEAINCGVPILGVPMFADQRQNLATLKAKGVAEMVEYSDINDATLHGLVNKILTTKSYRENARYLSELFNDRPLSAMDTAIYWFEYVLRHNGAGHLKSPAVDLAWYQKSLLDVAVFLLVCLLVATFVTFYTVRRLVSIYKSIISNNEEKYKSD